MLRSASGSSLKARLRKIECSIVLTFSIETCHDWYTCTTFDKYYYQTVLAILDRESKGCEVRWNITGDTVPGTPGTTHVEE